MNKLTYPTLDLFLYSLRDGLGEDKDDIKKNHANFWANLPENLKVPLSEEEKVENTEYVRLLEFSEAANRQKQFFFTGKVGDTKYPFEASYYPIRLSDTYALLFDCSVDDKNTPQPLTSLQQLKTLAENTSGNIGKTWMISGYISAASDPETVAKEAYEHFTAKKWQNYQKGSFLGATVFEVWQPPQKWQNVEEENSHVLIFLYPNLTTMGKTATFYKLWLQLFCYRNKILWAYGETQKRKRELHSLFAHIRDTIEKIEHISVTKGEERLSLKQLQELHKILSSHTGIVFNYVTKLSYLEMLQQTIATNLATYQQCLSDIVEKANDFAKKDSIIGETDLKFLQEFSKLVEQKYQAQIAKDYVILSPGSKVLENLINTIRGMVEIERVERDRTLNSTIAIAGIGLVSIGITVTITSTQLPQPQSKDTISISAAFFWSIAAGIIPVAIALILLRRFRR